MRDRGVRVSSWALPAFAGLLLSACGGVGQATFPSLSPDSSTKLVPSILAWDQCLRGHGVKVPTGYDPYNNKGSKIDYSAAAAAACQALLPPAPLPPAAQQLEMLSFTKCMRAHGIPVSDPTFGPGGAEITYGPGIGPNTPGFADAQKACHLQAFGG